MFVYLFVLILQKHHLEVQEMYVIIIQGKYCFVIRTYGKK